MKNLIVFLALIGLPMLAAAQERTLYYEGCPDTTQAVAVTQLTSLPFFGKSSDDLMNYFSEQLQPFLGNQSSGELDLRFIIDQNGLPCMFKFHSAGQTGIEPIRVKKIVDAMTPWQPAMQGDQPVAFKAMVNLRIEGTKVVARLLK